MSSTHRLRIRLQDHTYATVMAEAERREIDPSQVIDDYVNLARIAGLGGGRIYGSVLAMKTWLHQLLTQARLNGVDLEAMSRPVNALHEELNALHRLVLELNEVELNGGPQDVSDPMTLDRELRLELEHERLDDQGHAR